MLRFSVTSPYGRSQQAYSLWPKFSRSPVFARLVYKTVFVFLNNFLAVMSLFILVHRLPWFRGLGSRVGSVAVALRLSYPLACGILAPQPGIKPASPALQGGFLTVPPGKSPGFVFLNLY